MEIAGIFDELGHPHFSIEVFGVSKKSKVKIDVMFDTGFTGFLNLPLALCLQTGLVLYSTTSYKLADGRSSSTILCLGTIIVSEGNEITGAISIDFNTNEALMGMEFLRKIKGRLQIDTSNQKVKLFIP